LDLADLPTPCLLLDAAALRRNVAWGAERAAQLGVRLRPHVKTHKSIEVAGLQRDAGATSFTVSTLAEARLFAAHGFADLLYAVPIEPGKFAAAAAVARGCERLGLITDEPEVATALDQSAGHEGVAFDVWIDFDCGYGRTGVGAEEPRALELARRLAVARNLRFAGALTHAGHAYGATTRAEAERIAGEERDRTAAFVARCREATGAPGLASSIGSTPTFARVDHLRGVDEARPGNYAFFDVFQAAHGHCRFEDCAVSVLAAVVHRDRGRRRVILDAGAIALSKDRGPSDIDPACGYGRVITLEGADLGLRVRSVSQEHGWIEDVGADHFDLLPLGARVRVLANHSCLTVAQHDAYHVVEEERVVGRWAVQGLGTWR
jgi:D-serine deaminase-like pyridoxal phosphate-dependent protein